MDSKKNKKSTNHKKAAKYDSKFCKTAPDSDAQPKILLKPKDNTDRKKPEQTITIATKTHTKSDQEFVKEVSLHSSPHETTFLHPIVNRMVKSINLVNSNNILNVHAFDYLHENNADFFVIGVVGIQGSGKSTILNLLAADHIEDIAKQTAFNTEGGVFPISKVFKQEEASEFDDEIRMHITKDRIILLDSAPVLSNQGKKDFVFSELDDLRRIIFLLSVCHLLIIIQEDYFNINFVRLLRCAEMMISRNQDEMLFLEPRILFLKNNCGRKGFETQDKNSFETLCKRLFRDTRLKIYSDQDGKEDINVLHFPRLSSEDNKFTMDEDRISCIQKFREHVFMTPTDQTKKGPNVLTEKSWSQMVFHVMEGYNNNYFLRKYENLKEKYNLHNHVNVVENAAKEKSYLNFVESYD